ncbi:uncharacterized protein T551_03245 [Pneumocystis jirovecii RU7]|uniref:Phosphatidylinositol N-acetylglucosaminyltransferase subunit H conserved domain-containing protein n=2 Tax=Pneumocystis jirovecii TaxID=42068 RepID=A0A0W4ZFV1_PNEJ7|nr:uncharacterized protein T551_03245 [Pneumocystis jirovecii RU7]KTW27251.1 hypothetical protein T551_03245 [Pneumocystis jirovecii RU7]
MPLLIKRPSPDAVEFTYYENFKWSINCIVRILVLCTIFVFFLSVFMIFFIQYQQLNFIIYILQYIGLIQWIQELYIHKPYVFCSITVVFLYSICKFMHPKPSSESLLVLHNIGLQITLHYFLLPSRTRFIPLSDILDVVIHEGFIGLEVRYYLALIIRNEDTLQVIFENLLPRRKFLEIVYKEIRTIFIEK